MPIKNLLQLYALCVCLVSMLIIIVGTGLCLNYVINLAIPESMYHSNLVTYESNESYLKSETDGSTGYISEAVLKANRSRLLGASPEQIETERIQKKIDYLKNIRAANLSSFIAVFTWVAMALVFFFFHWRLFRKAK